MPWTEGFIPSLLGISPPTGAIAEGGAKWSQAWGTRSKDPGAPADPSQRALQDCEKASGMRCFLYAVDNRVVYRP